MGPISGGTGGSKDLNGHFLCTKFEVHSIILTFLSKNFKIKGFLRYLFQQIFNSTVGPIRMVSHLRGPPCFIVSDGSWWAPLAHKIEVCKTGVCVYNAN